MMDDGYDLLEVPIPALITVVKDINEPRIPSLKGKMKAKKAQITVLNSVDIEADPNLLGLKGSPTQVVKVFAPELNSNREMITGTIDEIVLQLFEKLEAV
jgi:electron transfer flavoprotein beta subunit